MGPHGAIHHDPVQVGAAVGGRRNEPRPQRMTTEPRHIEPGQFGIAFHPIGDGVPGDGFVGHLFTP